jgi:hypothetical protein
MGPVDCQTVRATRCRADATPRRVRVRGMLVLIAFAATACARSASPGATASLTASTSAPITAGVYGSVSAGPTCPVERAGQSCPPRPVIAEIDARDPSGATVATTHTDAQGGFNLALPPGGYSLVAVITTGVFPTCRPTYVTVSPGQQTKADIACDTGIR